MTCRRLRIVKQANSESPPGPSGSLAFSRPGPPPQLAPRAPHSFLRSFLGRTRVLGFFGDTGAFVLWGKERADADADTV